MSRPTTPKSSKSPIFQRPKLRRRHSMPLSLSSPKASPLERSGCLTPPPKSAARPKPTSKDDASLIEYCPTCGIQLYKMPSAFWKLKKKKRNRKPLHVPGRVDQGRCLRCFDTNTLDYPPAPPLLRRQTNILHIDFKDDDFYFLASEDAEEDQTRESTSTSFVYEGEYNWYGHRHGSGQMIWDNGDKYVGNFFNGLRDGTGSLFLQDGSEYTGEWELNKMHGQGTRYFANKDCYVGQYFRGARCGQGKMHFHNGDLYAGRWKDDHFHGKGKYFAHDKGQALEGNFVRGQKHGKFKVQRADGTLDVYNFDKDSIVGQGVRWSPKRDKTWLLSKPQDTTDERWILGRKMNKKRIPVVEAVSVGYECEGSPIEPVAMTVALSAIPKVNGRMLI